MATYSVNVTESYSYFPDNISGSQATVFAVTNSLAGASYYTLETVPPFGWYYSGSTPSISGSFTYTSGINNLVSDNYKMSVVVAPGGGSFTFTPAVPVTGSQLLLRGTSYKDVNNQASAVVSSFAAAVNGAGGLLTGSEYNALLSLTSDLISYNLLGKMKAVYPVVSSQRNLLSYTENLSNAAWNSAGATLLANNTTAPDGTNTAWRITRANSAFQGFSIRQNVSVISSTQYTFSVYLKAPNTSTTVEVDLGDGTTTPTITLTTDWQLYTFRKTLGASGAFFDFNITSGDGSYCWFWHPQLELGSSATAYQPTLGSADDVFKNSFKFNLINPSQFTGSFTSGWTFSPTGMKPNGTSAYMDTGLNPFLHTSGFSQHVSMYSRTQNSSFNGVQVGCYDGSAEVNLYQHYASANVKGSSIYFYPTTAAYINNITSNTLGFQIGSRTSNNSVKLYFNNSLLNTNNTVETLTRPNKSMYIGASNFNTAAGQFSPHENAFTSIGDGLTDTDASLFYLAVQRYQTLLNRQV